MSDHYETPDLISRIQAALTQAGLDATPVSWADLAPIDQFHTRGLIATKELATALAPAPGATILDIGSGLGGPARALAALHGCHVTGVDLSHAFVAAATMLSTRTGQSDTTEFQRADALALPFADASFDHAWTQHVAMNIANRDQLYREIHRVLRPGARLAAHDIVAGDGTPLTFPVPWAATPDQSHLLTPDAMQDALTQAGFTSIAMTDRTEATLAGFFPPTSPGRPALGLQITMGPGFPEMAANLAANMRAGRIRVVQVIATA